MTHIAYFISPHGFGHAARAAALMNALSEAGRQFYFDIFTSVPEWFFADSLDCQFQYQKLKTDIGFVQMSPLREDLEATLLALDSFLPFDKSLVLDLARDLSGSNCWAVVCDIAPLGIAVAQKAGIPSVLVENFTWDVLYGGYSSFNGRFWQHIDYLKKIFDQADFRIHTEPACGETKADLWAPPMSRKQRQDRAAVRRSLAITENQKLVVVTMGGIQEQYQFLERLKTRTDICFIIPGGSAQQQVEDNIILLPHRSWVYHPDLINACDALVGKAGYSTIAETFQAGVPFGYVPRPGFPEMEGLVAFIQRELPSLAILPEDFESGDWIESLDDLLAMDRLKGTRPNGADMAARFLIDKLLPAGLCQNKIGSYK